MTWILRCVWCDWHIYVGDRGARFNDPGAGVEAAHAMEEHVQHIHHKTWREFLELSR